jgi:CRISPR-associated Csx2 family protein
MAKILISSLGTGSKRDGSYMKANYEINQKRYRTSFIADALNKNLDFDKIYLVGTKKSIWDEAYLAFGGESDEYLEELYEKKELGEIEDEVLNEFRTTLPKLETIIVKYGLDNDELWDNFSEFLNIAKDIEDGDELYLDITHSFRSLALMSFVMAQFAHTISNKNFKIAGVFYGMFEYQGENGGVTPIVDIKILLEIQDWIKAIDAIKHYSDFNPLVRLLDENSIEKEVQNTFINLNNTISLANIASIRQFIDTASKKIRTVQNSENKIVKLLAPEILSLVDRLNREKMSDFQYELALWFYENKNYALSYMALGEAIITKTCELKLPDENPEDKDVRENAKRRIDHPYDKYYWQRGEDKDTVSEIRNNIAHQLNNRKDRVNQDIERLGKFLDDFKLYFEKI